MAATAGVQQHKPNALAMAIRARAVNRYQGMALNLNAPFFNGSDQVVIAIVFAS